MTPAVLGFSTFLLVRAAPATPTAFFTMIDLCVLILSLESARARKMCAGISAKSALTDIGTSPGIIPMAAKSAAASGIFFFLKSQTS